MPMAWLVPNHYPPWVSAWSDAWAFACLAFAALLAFARAAVQPAWLLAIGLAGASVIGQWLTGKVAFAGDALMVGLYLGAFAIALTLGQVVGQRSRGGDADALPDAVSAFALGLLAAAALSVAAALVQWTNVSLAGGWVVDVPPGARPFSNLAQPNHFSTAAFLGLAGLGVLREVRRVGPIGFWIGAVFMLLGIVMSGSRTGWLQLGLAAIAAAWYGSRATLAVRVRHVVVLALVGVALQAAWSSVDEMTGRHVDRPLDEKLAAGARPALWRDMAAAIARQPIAGFGWMQIGAAQQSVALDRPPQPVFFEHFNHAHNVVLDLLLWAGVPMGVLIVALGTMALWQGLRRLDCPRAFWLTVGAFGIIVHALLEFPHTFAYFLLPLGIMLGMARALTAPTPDPPPPRPSLVVPVCGATLAAALAVVAVDYLHAEENFRAARLQTARIGTDSVTSDVPNLRVLTQLESFLRFVRTEARPGMSANELAWMGQVSQRFGFAPVLFRYALALGLNGQPEEAARTLQLLCHVHSRKRCQEARDVWPSLQERHPALREVPAP